MGGGTGDARDIAEVESCRTASPSPLVRVPPHAEPALSFVIVTYGTGGVVVEAIASLVRSLAGTADTYEVIVVDNEHPGVPDRTFRRLLVDTAGVRVIRPRRNLGFGGGCDLGVAAARGGVLGLLNPDIELSVGWLAPLREQLRKGAAIAAPVLVEPDGAVQSAGHRLLVDGFTEPVTQAPVPGTTSRPDYASAACWVLDRSTYQVLGGFDESFFPAYYEDVDFALRARSLGGTTVAGDVRVVHHRGASTAATVVPDTTPQRRRLIEKWPELSAPPIAAT